MHPSSFGTAVQPDGKILLAGSTTIHRKMMLVRLLPDGRWDHSFGHAGSALTFLEGGDAEIQGVVVQPDGRIVVGGWKTPLAPGWPLALFARYLPNGALDPTFGRGGLVTHELKTEVSGMALQPDGKLVGAGSPVFRLLPNGALDTSFGSNGVAPTGYGVDVGLQADGKIVTVFNHYSGPPTGYDFGLLQLLPNGSPDPSFSTALVDMANTHDEMSDVAIAGDGRIISAGAATVEWGPAVALARHLPNGELDQTFGDGGRQVARALKTSHSSPVRVAVQSDGKAVVAFTEGSDPKDLAFGLARFNVDGGLDASFGDGGVTLTRPPGQDGVAHGLVRTPTGEWVVGGSVTTDWWAPSPAAVRHHGDGGTTAARAVTAESCRKDAQLSSLAGRNFGAVAVGMRSAARTFLLTNTGTAPITPSGVGLIRPRTEQFRIVHDACTNRTVAPGAACAVSVAFAPSLVDYSVVELVVWDDGRLGLADHLHPGGGVRRPLSGELGLERLRAAGAHRGALTERIALPNTVGMAAGYYYSLALRSDGTVWAWGWNGMGQLGDGTNVNRHAPVRVGALTDVVAIAAGAYHSLRFAVTTPCGHGAGTPTASWATGRRSNDGIRFASTASLRWRPSQAGWCTPWPSATTGSCGRGGGTEWASRATGRRPIDTAR